MPKYLCHVCARSGGYLNPVDTSPLPEPTGGYQFEKFLKHTAPAAIYPENSVFNEPSWENYKGYMVTGAESGCLEIDDQGRNNLIYFAGKEVGLKFDNGAYSTSCSGVKLVCFSNVAKVHVFPSDFVPLTRICENCGRSVPFDPTI